MFCASEIGNSQVLLMVPTVVDEVRAPSPQPLNFVHVASAAGAHRERAFPVGWTRPSVCGASTFKSHPRNSGCRHA